MDSHTPLRPVLLGGLTNTPGRCQQVWQFPPWTQDQRGSCQCLYPHLFLSAKSGSTHRCWKCQTIFQQSVGNPSISTCHLDACPAQRHPGRCRVATRRGSRENPHFPARRAPEHRSPSSKATLWVKAQHEGALPPRAWRECPWAWHLVCSRLPCPLQRANGVYLP